MALVRTIGDPTRPADICLILEGTYPYVSGGVSSWAHELLQAHLDQTFHLLSIIPPGAKTRFCYEPPSNVVSLQTQVIQEMPPGKRVSEHKQQEFFKELKPLMLEILTGENPQLFVELVEQFSSNRKWLGAHTLIRSSVAWEFILELYEELFVGGGFLDFFWSLTVLMKSLFSILLLPLPNASIFHSLSTGYGGLLLARAKIEKKAPCLLTEHGLYTNERRIEISVADWLSSPQSLDLTFGQRKLSLRDYWLNIFLYFSRACYVHCDKIITLFSANQDVELAGGAKKEQLGIIANGVDIDFYQKFSKSPSKNPRTIALIGRVVPIKDVKTFIRAVGFIKQYIPDIQALILGPQDEDPEYVQECFQLVDELDLQETVHLKGKVSLADYLASIDLTVLTSVSESQPLVILEAGAAGIPAVATNVGACKELIYGKEDESPPLGEGGTLIPLADPEAAASGCLSLLLDSDRYQACCEAMRKRVATYYCKDEQHQAYTNLYGQYLGRK